MYNDMFTKYMINGFVNPYGMIDAQKQTNWLVVAVMYFVVYSLQYNAVDLTRRVVD